MPFFASIDPLRRRFCGWLAGAGLSAAGIATAASRGTQAADLQRMLDDIARLTLETRRETGRSALSDRVMAALAKVERHRFVPPEEESRAYQNRPLPIGAGQTISQPFIVALMTDFMDLQPNDKVLEVGTGSGYQAAVLAELAGMVYTIEIVESLAREAAERLRRLGYTNIVAKAGDGYLGWPQHAPFDSIMVTAAASHIPQPLVDQLKPGGRMVIPVGTPWGSQTLTSVQKSADGAISRHEILAVRFVPLTRSPDR